MRKGQPRARLSPPLFAVALLLAMTAPLGSATSNVIDVEPLDASDIALLETLSAWVDTEETPANLRREIRDRSTNFEVFRSYHDADERYRRLDEGIPYGNSIRRVAEKHGLDGLLLAAVIEAESSFNPQATSSRGAVGLMQVLPSTAGESPERLYEPELNLEHGAQYLKGLLERFGGDLELALAAYNAGPSNVIRYDGIPPFRETRRYVEKVLDLYFDHHREVWQSSQSGELLTS
ncbi:MAG: lytic transglycosylase domain-containing protein [Acidobacteriota bacterium]